MDVLQAGTIIALLGFAFAIYRWITSIQDDMHNRFEREREQRLSLERNFAAFQLIAAQTYVPSGSLRATEERLVAVVEKLEVQIGNLGERFDRFVLRSEK